MRVESVSLKQSQTLLMLQPNYIKFLTTESILLYKYVPLYQLHNIIQG